MDYRDYNKQIMKKAKKTKLVLIAVLAVVAVLLSAVFFIQTTGENKGYRTISVVEVSGNVSVVKEGIEYRAYPGLLLQEGHEIVTSANSYVRLVLDDDKYVKLEAGSRLVFETLGLMGTGKTQMRLERGALVTEITNPLGGEEEFVVNTPNAVLAVRGTFFRVDLNQYDKGEITADVMTYGGLVASSRVLPTGEKVEEEVLIDAGYKATINMTKEDTNYVVDLEDGDTVIVDPSDTEKPDDENQSLLPTQPITTDDISDEDLIDVYFAAENGHELFVTTEEVEADLEVREINIEDQKSVYEKAKEVKKKQEAEGTIVGGTDNTTDVTIKADDSQPLVKVEESKPEEDKNDSTTTTPNTNTGTSGLVDGEHVHIEKRTIVAATCTTDGSVVVTCRECKETIRTTMIPAVGHDMEITEYVAPSCTTAGSESYACACGYVYSDIIDKLPHNKVDGGTEEAHSKCSVCNTIISAEHTYTETERVESTCGEEGHVTYHCACGYEFTDIISKKEHDWGEWQVLTEATCEDMGFRVRYCKNDCRTEQQDTIVALGHTEIDGGIEDTHTKCSECNKVLSTEHEMTQTHYAAPSCTSTGYAIYACDCGYTYTERLAELGHTFGEWEVTKEVTCDYEGFVERKCTACSHTELQVLEPLGHDFPDEFVVTKEATCTESGLKVIACTRCDFVSQTQEILATGHSVGEWTEVSSPTCTTNGENRRECSTCYETEIETIPALGHTEVDGGTADAHTKCSVCGEILGTEHIYTDTETTAATCQATGIMTHTCNCGYEYTSEIPLTDHKYKGEYTIDQEATCTEDGSQSIHCIHCDYRFGSIPIEAIGHVYDSWRTTVLQTCANDGEEKRTCKNCEYFETRVIPAEEHTYGRWTEHSEATCTTDGLSTKTCSECGYVYESITEAYGHSVVPGNSQEAHSKCEWCGEVFSTEHQMTNTETVAPGCTVAGSRTFACDCGYTYTEEIDAVGHNEVYGGTQEAHTKCSNCNEIFSAEHSFTEVFVKTATCTENGETFHHCVCEYEYTSYSEAKGHSYVEREDTGDDGYVTTYEECERCGDKMSEYTYLAVDGIHFPDDKLRELLSQPQYNTDGIDGLTREEVAAITSLDLSGEGNEGQIITDGGYSNLDGIEYLTALESLDISYNSAIQALDLEGITRIKTVDATGSGITVLFTTGCSQLETLSVDYCSNLNNLDISDSVNLLSLSMRNIDNLLVDWADVGHYALATLDARGTSIGTQYFDKINQVQVLKVSADEFDLDLTSFTNLTDLYIGEGTAAYSLNVSGLSLLRNIVFEERNSIDEILATDIYLNSSIDFSKCPDLTILDLSRTSMSEIDLTYNDKLTSLKITGNSSIATLDVNNKTSLTQLEVQDCSMLQMLYLNATSVTSLDLSGCTMMQTLRAIDCESLAMVDLSDCSIISSVDLSNTALTMMSTQQSNGVIVVPESTTPTMTYLNLSYTQMNFSNCSADKYTWWGALKILVLIDAGVTDTHWNSRISTYLPQTLQELNLSHNSVTALDLSGRSAINALYLEGCEELTSIDLSGCTGLTRFNLTDCTALESLNVDGCTSITELDFSGYDNLTKLTYLNIANNGNLKSVNFSTLTALSTVDLAMSGSMTYINISNTQLTNFDSTGMPYVETYICQNATKLANVYLENATPLSSLDVTGCSSTLHIYLSTGSSLYGTDYANTITGFENTMSVN